ncbi:muscarinic acetylcholine receptor M1-like [Oppia nitens]|uniref:muscarinic acetylcholine receptor M1-like n=1 Tax=Oppia nitens TaxID=1686743 RepID=UPI0023DBC6AE|nr:muscarinic acetylcholine receptor M1-like [Oppia nitens]
MVVHAIRTERKLHTVSNMFIMSLAIADLTVGLIVMPISSVYVLLGDWTLGLVVCQLWLVIDYTASTASIFNLLILSLDRYWSIRSPLKYLCKRTKKRALGMIGIVWLISILWVIPIIGWHLVYSNGVRKHPDNVCETEFSDSILFKLTTSAVNFFIPMILMVVIYYKIFCEIKRRGKIDIGRSLSVSCADHSTTLSRSSLRKQRKLFQRNNYKTTTKTKGCSSCSSFPATTTTAKQIIKMNLVDSEKCSQTDRPSIDRPNSRDSSDEIKCQNKLQSLTTNTTTSAAAVISDKPTYSVDDSFLLSSAKQHYQQLTLMSVKPEKSSLTALEDYKGVKVEVEYINGGSVVNIVNTTHLDNKQPNDQKLLNTLSTIKTSIDTKSDSLITTTTTTLSGYKSQQQISSKNKHKTKCKSNTTKLTKRKNVNNGSEDDNQQEMDELNISSKSNSCLRKTTSNKSSLKINTSNNTNNSLEISRLDSRLVSRPSIALPANELCIECQSTAAAAVAATHHMNALRREESSRLRQEKKAARQLGVILGAFILCWMPYIITFIVTAHCPDCVSSTVHQVAIWLGYVNSFLNPFLYALCNENFKQAFKKMLGRVKTQQPSYNFDLTHGTSFRVNKNNFA